MFEGIRKNIGETLSRLRHLDVGKTARNLREARIHANRKKRARREFLDDRDKALDEWEKLVKEGRPKDDEHLRNLHHRIRKADLWADEMGERRADLARRGRRLKKVLKQKSDARKRLLRELKERRENLRKARAEFEHEQQSQGPATGVGYFDGKPVAAWMIPILSYARSHGWSGSLTSGWRSPAYSTQLCYSICGAPTCPGRCAGAGSAHSQSTKPAGAVDVSDPYGFARSQGSLVNRLGSSDPWHYSTSGY